MEVMLMVSSFSVWLSSVFKYINHWRWQRAADIWVWWRWGWWGRGRLQAIWWEWKRNGNWDSGLCVILWANKTRLHRTRFGHRHFVSWTLGDLERWSSLQDAICMRHWQQCLPLHQRPVYWGHRHSQWHFYSAGETRSHRNDFVGKLPHLATPTCLVRGLWLAFLVESAGPYLAWRISGGNYVASCTSLLHFPYLLEQANYHVWSHGICVSLCDYSAISGMPLGGVTSVHRLFFPGAESTFVLASPIA